VTVDKIIDAAIGREGGYSNHPADRGGPTKWGITEAVARKNGFTGDMRTLDRAGAVNIYKNQYWHKPGFSKVHDISPRIAEELFDTGINMGPAVPIGFLQRALNALNRNGKDYSDIAVDHNIGPATLSALNSYIKLRGKEGEDVLMKALEALQGERYIKLAEGRAANEAFLYGWLRTRIGQS